MAADLAQMMGKCWAERLEKRKEGKSVEWKVELWAVCLDGNLVEGLEEKLVDCLVCLTADSRDVK